MPFFLVIFSMLDNISHNKVHQRPNYLQDGQEDRQGAGGGFLPNQKEARGGDPFALLHGESGAPPTAGSNACEPLPARTFGSVHLLPFTAS